MSFPLDKNGENILIQLDVQNLVLEEPGLWEFEMETEKCKELEKRHNYSAQKETGQYFDIIKK